MNHAIIHTSHELRKGKPEYQGQLTKYSSGDDYVNTQMLLAAHLEFYGSILAWADPKHAVALTQVQRSAWGSHEKSLTF